MESNPFAKIMEEDAGAEQPDAVKSQNPFAKIMEEEDAQPPSAGGAFMRSAARNAIPGAAGFAGAGAGAEAGGLLGAAVAGPPGALVGGVLGGLGGAVLGTGAVAKAQDYALKALPDSWQEAIGQSDRQQRLDEEAHPYASFLGGVAPFALTMNPFGTAFKTLPAGATAMDKIMAYQPAERLFGGTVMGGMELGQEAVGNEPIDWRKVAISTGSGIVFNTTNRFGHYLTEVGGKPARSLAEAAGLRVAGPGITESVASGAEKANLEADQANQEQARFEEASTAEPPKPDIHDVARRLDPEAFEKYDSLAEQKEEFRRQIAELNNPTEESFQPLRERRAELAHEWFELPRSGAGRTPETQRRLRQLKAEMNDVDREIDALNERRAAFGAGEGQEALAEARLGRRLLETDIAMRDLSPTVGAAYRRAEEAIGAGEAGAEHGIAPEVTGKVEVAPEAPAKAEIPIAKQKATIAEDVKRQMVAAGRPAEEAEKWGQAVAARYAARPWALYGDEGPLALYTREGARIEKWEPSAPTTAPEAEAPAAVEAAPPGAESAAAPAEPAAIAPAGPKTGDKITLHGTKYKIGAIDENNVTLEGAKKGVGALTLKRGVFDQMFAEYERPTESAPAGEVFSIGGEKITDPKLAALLRDAMERPREEAEPRAPSAEPDTEALRRKMWADADREYAPEPATPEKAAEQAPRIEELAKVKEEAEAKGEEPPPPDPDLQPTDVFDPSLYADFGLKHTDVDREISLLSFLDSVGGLAPHSEIAAIFDKKMPKFGYKTGQKGYEYTDKKGRKKTGGARSTRPLVREGGLDLDQALEAARAQGYLTEEGDITGGNAKLTPNHLLDLIRQEAKGSKVFRQSAGEGNVRDRMREGAEYLSDFEKHKKTINKQAKSDSFIAAALEREGGDRILTHAADLMAREPRAWTPQTAIEEAISIHEREHQRTVDQETEVRDARIKQFGHTPDWDAFYARYGDAGWFDHLSGEWADAEKAAELDARAASLQRAQPARAGEETAGASGISERPGEEVGRAGGPEGTAPAYETGAEGLPQGIISGTEHISDRALAERMAEKPLRGGNEPIEGGLFGGKPEEQDSLFQRKREPVGAIRFDANKRATIWLSPKADPSTIIHESGHDFLEQLRRDGSHKDAPDRLKGDLSTVHDWLGVKPDQKGLTVAQHEKFARGFEAYFFEGRAPTKELAGVFSRFKEWLHRVYDSVKGLGNPPPEVRDVFDRMFGAQEQRAVVAPERARRPSIADEHEIDARLTPAHHAEPAMSRIMGEAARGEAETAPEIANEFKASDEAARPSGDEPAGENATGADSEGSMGPAGGGSEPVAQGVASGDANGEKLGGGGKAGAEGAGLPDWTGVGRTGTDERSDAGRSSKSPLEPAQRDKFGPTESKVTDLAGNIRLENLTDEESVRQSLRESAERNNEFKDQRGSATKAQIYDAAEAMGYEPGSREAHKFAEDLLSRTGNLARDVLAARMLVVKSAERINALAKRLAESKSDEDAYALALAVTQHDMVQSTVAGVTASWGRTGNAFHSLLHGWGDAQKLNQVLKENTGRTLFQMKQLGLLLSELDTPESVSKAIRDAGKRSWGRMVLEYWINGLISGPTTHMTYGIGNTLLAMTKLGPETAAAAVIGALRKDATRERVRFGEIGEQIKGATAVAPGAAKAAATSATTGMNVRLPGEKPRAAPYQVEGVVQPMHVLEPGYECTKVMPDLLGAVRGARDAAVAAGALLKAGKGGFEKQLSASGQIPNFSYNGVTVAPVGTIARLPSHGVAAIHSFFKSFNYSMEIYAQAYRKAVAEAEEKGLAGEDYKNHIAMRTAQLRQDPTPQMMQNAHKEAYDLTLMGQGGEVTKLLSRLTNIPFFEGTRAEVPLLKFIDPFVHISSNIISETLGKRTPLGWLSPEIRKDLMGGNGPIAQDKAQARMLLGTLYGLGFASIAAEGYATGSGPKAPDEAMLWRMAGNQAHSVRIGNMWYDTHRLGPLGMLFSLSADAYQVAQHAGEGDVTGVMTSLHHAFIQNILDESFMRGPAEAIRAIEQPERYGRQWVDNFASSFVPYSVAMSQMERAVDPYSRNARNIIDTVKSKLPFESLYGTVMPRRDIWGEELPNKEALGMKGLTAIYVQKMNDDPVNHAMLDLSVHKGQVERRIRGIDLNEQQFDDYARIAGRMTKQRLDVIVNSPDFQRMPNWVRKSVIEKVIEQNRETARGMMMMKYPEIPAQALNNKRALYGQ
jgi:hypothetical protein